MTAASSTPFPLRLPLLAAGIAAATGCAVEPSPGSDDLVTATHERAESSATVEILAGAPGGLGNLDGIGAAARFDMPSGIAYDGAGTLFVSDNGSSRIRKVVVATGEVTTLAEVTVGSVADLVYDGAGNLFVASGSSSTVLKIAVATGEATTLAGAQGQPGSRDSTDGTGGTARLYSPTGLASDGSGNLYVTDFVDSTIRKIVIATGEVTTLAGTHGQRSYRDSTDGTGASAFFDSPKGVTVDGGYLFVADTYNDVIRKVLIATGEVTTLAGSPGRQAFADGTGSEARFCLPEGILADGRGHLLVADGCNSAIRRVDIASGSVTTLAGIAYPGRSDSSDGTGRTARFAAPHGLTFDGADRLWVTELWGVVREVSIATGETRTLAGSSQVHLEITDGVGSAAQLRGPQGITSDGAGTVYFTSDESSVRKLDVATGSVSTLAGGGDWGHADGRGATAQFDFPYGITSDGNGNLYVADGTNNSIRKIVIATGVVTTLAGNVWLPGDRDSSDGTGRTARFDFPSAIAYDGAGHLLVVDGNSRVRSVDAATGATSTLARWYGAYSQFEHPPGIAYDGAGNLYIPDAGNHVVRRLAVATGELTIVAGAEGVPGSTDGSADASRFSAPVSVALDRAGHLLIADRGNHCIRQLDLATGEVSTVLGSPGSVGVRPGPAATASLNAPTGLLVTDSGDLLITDRDEAVVLRARLR